MKPNPQFTAELRFHFNEHAAPDRRRWFMFGEDLHRRVPMSMNGVDGLNTIGMWVKEPSTFHPGDTARVDCVVVAPEIFSAAIRPGVSFELWDGGYFATGTVLERFDTAWPDRVVGKSNSGQ